MYEVTDPVKYIYSHDLSDASLSASAACVDIKSTANKETLM